MDRHLRRVIPHAIRRQAIRRKTRRCHARFYAGCAHWSFHDEAPPNAFRWARERWIVGGGALLLALLTLVGLPAWAKAMQHRAAQKVPLETVALKLPPAPPPAPTQPFVASWKTVAVQPGQTLSDIFQAQGLGNTEVAAVMASGKGMGALKTLHPGDELQFKLDAKGGLEGFRFNPDSSTLLTLTAGANGYKVTSTSLPVDRRMQFAHGVVTGSLFAAGEKAGLSDTMVLRLADVFKYDVDFIKDIRHGDTFTVVYDDIYRNGKFVRAGDIIAAEFSNGGKRYTAYRFKEPDGSVAYFTQDGRPLKKGLLRTPVSFTRVSSTFGMRKDPVLGYTRLHKGVDYAAPIGTPVHAAGNGVIVRRGWVHGYGNFIAIKNTPEYTTAYGHMSRFAKGLHVGSHVTQGEVIGYVGETGFATGPHLHYEVRVDGRPENPLTVTMPKPQPLSGQMMVAFRAQTAPWVARIRLIDDNTQRLASADSHSSSRHTD